MKQEVLYFLLASFFVLSGCGWDLECGAGTEELDGECVAAEPEASLVCGAGTEERAGICVPTDSESSAACGVGTTLANGECVSVECGEGRVLLAGVCRVIDELCIEPEFFNLETLECVTPSSTTCSVDDGQAGCAGGPFYVDDDAMEGGDGTSWATAFRFLQDAIEARRGLRSDAIGIEIWVAAGTYTPDRADTVTLEGDNFERSFWVPSGTILLGGFAGGETNPAERDPGMQPVLLSGDLAGDDTADSNRADNSCHVVILDRPDGVVIDGVSVRGGNASDCDARGEVIGTNGGGLYQIGGLSELRRVTLQDNYAAFQGGGAFIDGGVARLVDVKVMDNAGARAGGGVYGSVEVVRSRFEGNAAELGGAMDVGDSTVLDSEFANNEAVDGGAIRGRVTVVHSRFVGNTASNRGGAGDGSITLVGCIATGNGARSRGAAFHQAAAILSSTIVNSLRLSTSISLPPIYTVQSAGRVSNSIIVENDTDGEVIDVDSRSLQYSCIGESAEGIGLVENCDPLFVDLDGPDNLRGTADDDLRLNAASPAIDAGNSTDLPEDILDVDADQERAEPLPLDFAGLPRAVDVEGVDDSGKGTAPLVDMGAYEFQP